MPHLLFFLHLLSLLGGVELRGHGFRHLPQLLQIVDQLVLWLLRFLLLGDLLLDHVFYFNNFLKKSLIVIICIEHFILLLAGI